MRKENSNNVIPIGLPHYHEAEITVIGTIMTTPSCVHGNSEKLNPDYFFDPKHKIIISAINDLIALNVPPDFVSVYDQLRMKGDNVKCGDLEGVRFFLEFNSRPELLSYWLDEIKKYWSLRLIIETCSFIGNKARSVVGSDIDEFLALAEAKFFAISESKMNEGLVPAPQVVNSMIKELEILVKNKERYGSSFSGIESGLTDLDAITGGFQKSDLIILAARPGMGKTSLALNFACNAVFKHNKYVAIFSLEMSNTQLMQRIVSSTAKIESTKFRTGELTPDEYERMKLFTDKFIANSMFFNDAGGITIGDIASRCRKMKREKDELDLIIVDYLQLITVPSDGKKNLNREREISTISMGLKNLAKEMNCPVIALSQLNRNLETRIDKRPYPADLRDSGSIEQDADLILFIYRDEVYNKNSNDIGIAEIILSKNRHGKTDTIRTSFDSKYTTFYNLPKNGYR